MDKPNSLNSFRQLMIEELNKDEPDTTVILTLSKKIAELDPNKARFTVDAGHLNRLGLELVSKRETALSELIKNAYDADATSVKVTFNDDENSLRIDDNGLGMSLDELREGFMRLSTNMKAENEYSKLYGRYRAGRKGIGRFAAQRLGKELTVLTKTKSSEYALELSINWEDFTSGIDLFTVTSKINQLSSSESEKIKVGTSLIIGKLREPWSEAQIRRVYRYASDILLPYPIAKNDITTKSGSIEELGKDPGFSATFWRINNAKHTVIADAEEMYLKHSLATVEGEIDSSGNAFWRLTSKKYNYDSGKRNYVTKTFQEYKIRQSDKARKFAGFSIGNISFKAYYFHTREKHFPVNLTSIISENLRSFGGIRLYRNGFRVLPYGERYDDWLRLDFVTRNRVILPPSSNNNFFGFVKITPSSIGEFEEVASREGLIENDSYIELREFVADSIISAMVEFAYVRKIKAFANQDDYQGNAKPSNIEERASFLKEKLEEVEQRNKIKNNTLSFGIDNTTTFDSKIDTDPNPARTNFQSGQNKIEMSQDEFDILKETTLKVLDDTNIYRVLGGLGLAMAEFTHEVKYSVASLNSYLIHSDDNNTILKDSVSRLLNYVNLFEGGFQSLSNNLIETIDLRACVNDFITTIDSSRELAHGVKISLVTDGNEFFIKEAHEATILAVFMNLYSNAKKAILRADGSGSIQINLKENDSNIELYFSDQGDGVDEKDREKIFDLFYTRSASLASNINPENDEMLGMGLGLPIVRELLSGIKGKIELTDPIEGFSTTFLVTLPKETDEDLLDEMY